MLTSHSSAKTSLSMAVRRPPTAFKLTGSARSSHRGIDQSLMARFRAQTPRTTSSSAGSRELGGTLPSFFELHHLVPIEEVGPILHHASPGDEILGSVVSTSDVVLFGMGKLHLDPILMVLADPDRRPAKLDQLLVGPSAGEPPETMDRLPTMIAKPV